MLTLGDHTQQRNCQGVSRRQFLQIGSLGFGGTALGLGGLSLSSLLATQAAAATGGKPLLSGKSVVLLFLHGGPSHIELFDPKMSAPVEIRSTTGELATSLPGVTFGGTFPKLAALAHKLTVVRSYASGNSEHSYNQVASGGNAMKAAMGSIYSRVAGTNHPVTGMPRNTLVLPESIEPGLKLKNNFETGALPTLTSSGDLGPSYTAFNSAGGGQLKQSMELQIPRERLDNRRGLLASLDSLRRSAETGGQLAVVDRFQQQAFDVITRGVAEAFDLSKEDRRTIERYDTSRLVNMAEVHRYNDMYRSSNLLGKQMLLARRLIEAGCGFVTVSDAGWDMHGNNNSLPGISGIKPLGHQVDHAVAAFIQDLEERGLSDKVLLVVTGEMGRTPRINKGGGRDHYGELTPLLFAGGGLNMGQVIGESDRTASRPAADPQGPPQLMATIMHTLFDMGEMRVTRDVPSDVVKMISRHEPIPGLM